MGLKEVRTIRSRKCRVQNTNAQLVKMVCLVNLVVQAGASGIAVCMNDWRSADYCCFGSSSWTYKKKTPLQLSSSLL